MLKSLQGDQMWDYEQGPVSKILVILCLALVLGFAIRVLYNLFFHPLNRIPGPWFAKVSNLYLIPAGLRLKRAQTLLKLHRQYGPFVRIGINEVSIADWRLYRELYSGTAKTIKTRFYDTGDFLGHRNIFSFTNKAQHRARRKMESQPYSQQTVFDNESLIATKADVMIRRLVDLAQSSSTGRTVEVYRLCGLFSLEVILKCTFNHEVGESIDGESWELLQAMEDGTLSLAIRGLLPWLKRPLGKLIPGFVGHAFKQFDKWHSMTSNLRQEFNKHESSSDKTRRFLTTPLLTGKDEFLGRSLTMSEVDDEVMGIALAGSGTTSTTLAYLFYALSRPEGQQLQARLRKELEGVGETLRELQGSPYLTAVIKETLRLYPTIISTLPRILEAPLTLPNGATLPTGTVVGMQNYVHHHDPDVFPAPEKFIPERWLDQETNKDMNAALTPFSVGPRNCLGQNLARAELYLAVSKTFRRVRLTLNSSMTEADMEMQDRFTTVPSSGKLLLDVELI